MISNKKITLISVVLVVICVAAVILMMIFYDGNFADGNTGVITYGDMHSVTYGADDYFTAYSEGNISKIKLLGETAAAESQNVSINGSEIKITGGGTYVLSGELTDGSIVVDSADKNEVRLVLNGAGIYSSGGAAIYVKQAEKTVISLVEGSENYLEDSESYSEYYAEEGVSAALYSRDDLTINGKGTLFINAVYEDAVKANDRLKITEGVLKINAADDGINANDYVAMRRATVEIVSGGDAIKSENESPDTGFVAIDNAQINIESSKDGIYASSALYVTDSKGKITTGGGSETVELSDRGLFEGRGWQGFEDDTASTSTKALKAGDNIVISGGEMSLNSKDDCIHSDNNLSIEKAVLEIASGDDAIHAEKNAVINAEKINITKSLEGIEAGFIVINGGEISIISSDDGINAVGESTNSRFGMPMVTNKENITDEEIYLSINGGNVYIECGGDGVDSNGAAVINGGTVTVFGPENNGNSSLDFQYGFIINGGTLVAAGSSGMAELPHNTSTQNSAVFYFDKTYNSGSTITLADDNGNEILSSVSAKRFDWLCISCADIKSGGKYNLTIEEDTYQAEITEIVTSVGRTGRRSW